jgi:hypothetical protein
MESGHAKNINNFETMINRCLGYDTRFNPANSLLKILALQTVLTNANTAMSNIETQANPRTNAINIRQELFLEMQKLATRVLDALIASEDVTQRTVDDAKTYIRKIRGERKSKKILNPSPEDPKQISASQHSYANQVEFYDKLIQFALTQPNYIPNETDLQKIYLEDFETQLRTATSNCIALDTPWLNALAARNDILYAPKSGLVDRALAVKKYVRSVKDITFEEYKQISGLKFTRPRKKK